MRDHYAQRARYHTRRAVAGSAGDRGATSRVLAVVRERRDRDSVGRLPPRGGWKVAFTETPDIDARIGSIPPAVQGGRWRASPHRGSAAEAAASGPGRAGADQRAVHHRRDRCQPPVRAVGPPCRGGSRDPCVTAASMIRFSAGTYNRVRAQPAGCATPTGEMRRIRAAWWEGSRVDRAGDRAGF